MYGLINGALKDMVKERFGEEKWLEVLEASGVPNDSFLSLRTYDDNVTFALAEAASKVLATPLDDCLEMFGQYWVLVTASNSYGSLLDAAGGNLFDLLQNLDALHDHITTTFKDYCPPSFRIEKLDGQRHRVHYVSEREGLDSFVIGLLKGLGTRFGNDIRFLSQTSEPVQSGTHTVFDIAIGSG